jgi:hypothetical protein
MPRALRPGPSKFLPIARAVHGPDQRELGLICQSSAASGHGAGLSRVLKIE